MPNVRHFVRLAVKAEQFQSSPSEATVWVPVCERVCSVTSRALVSLETRFWCHGFTEGERTSPGSANRTPSRTKIARIFTRISMHTKIRPHWCSGVCVCDGTHAAACGLALVL